MGEAAPVQTPIQIIFCMMQQDRLESVRRNVLRVLPHVDRAVIVDNGSTDGTLEWLEGLSGETSGKVLVVPRQWDDNFVEGRNAYVRAAGEIAEASGDAPTVICVADDDEIYSDGLLRDIRAVVSEMYLSDINVLGIESQTVVTDWKGDAIVSKMDAWHKPLFLLWEKGLEYRHGGKTAVHEDPYLPSGVRWNILVADGLRYYSHVKKHGEIWLRGIRNAFAGGGGMNLGDLVPFWKDFTSQVRELTRIENSNRFVKYLQAGDIHPWIAQFFVEHRLIGTKFDPRADLWPLWPDGCSEWREGFLSYYVYLWPDQMPLELAEADREYMNYAAEVRIIHGPKSPAWAQE